MPLHHAAQVFVVGDHGGYLAGHVTALPAMEDICKTVGGVAGQQHHSLQFAIVPQCPAHFTLSGQWLELLPKLLKSDTQGVRADHIAHKKPALLHIGMVIGLGEGTASVGDEL